MNTFNSLLATLNRRLTLISEGRMSVWDYETTQFDQFDLLWVELIPVTKEKIDVLTRTLTRIKSLIVATTNAHFYLYELDEKGNEAYSTDISDTGHAYKDLIIEELNSYKEKVEKFATKKTKNKPVPITDGFPINATSMDLGVLLGYLFDLKVLTKDLKVKRFIEFLSSNLYSTIEQHRIDPDLVYNKMFSLRPKEKDKLQKYLDGLKSAIDEMPASQVSRQKPQVKRSR